MRAFVEWARQIEVDATVSVRQLRRWEGGDPPTPHPGQQAVLEAMFGLPLGEMGFAVPKHRRGEQASVGDHGPVHRRQFIAGVGGVTAAAALSGARQRVGMADVRALREQIDRLYRIDHATGGRAAHRHAQVLLHHIGKHLTGGVHMERITAQLHAMLGEIHCHLGWISHDAGHGAEARTSVLEAMAAARMTGDLGLELRALSTMSLLAVEQHRPWEAASAVNAAQTLAHGHAGPGVRLVLALREARAALAASDLNTSRRALSQAIALQERAVEEDSAPRWVRFAGPVEIDYATGTYYVQAGKPLAAIPFLRAAVNGLASSYTRNTALYRARLATVLLDAGEVEEACAEICHVVQQAHTLASARLAIRLATFRRAAARIDSRTAKDAIDLLDTSRNHHEDRTP